MGAFEKLFFHVWSCDAKRSHSVVITLATVGDSCLTKFVNVLKVDFSPV